MHILPWPLLVLLRELTSSPAERTFHVSALHLTRGSTRRPAGTRPAAPGDPWELTRADPGQRFLAAGTRHGGSGSTHG